jgi:guanine deaminase
MEALPAPLRRTAEAMKAQPTAAILSAARDILVHWRHDRARIRPALGPTIPLHCSADFLRGCRDLARDFDTRIQTHLAESKTQAVLGYTKFGKSLVAHLADLELLGPGLSGAHGIWLEPDDIKRLADTGSAIVHNPTSNLRLGSGVAPAREILAAGGRLGIGTDASNTSDGQNMFEAMRLAAYLSRIASEDPDRWLDAEEAFRAATETSASILGFEKLGKLEPGYLADVVFLRLDHINYVPLRAPALQVVFAENGAAIDSVMIDGRMVLREGKLTTIDEAAVRREAEAAAVRLDEANQGAARDALPFADIVGHFCLAHARAPFPVHRRLPDRP